MSKRDLVILNDYKRNKGLARGRKVGVEIKADRIEHNFDEMELARGPAEAMKEAVVRAIRGIAKTAKSATTERRQRSGSASRKPWVVTGRLLRGLVVAKGRDGYETRASSDRLSGPTAELAEKLVEEAGISGRELMRDKGVREAVAESVGVMVSVEKG